MENKLNTTFRVILTIIGFICMFLLLLADLTLIHKIIGTLMGLLMISINSIFKKENKEDFSKVYSMESNKWAIGAMVMIIWIWIK